MRTAFVFAAASILSFACGPSSEQAGSPESRSLRAFGNEPFWNVAISVDSGMVYARLGEPGVRFPYAAPTTPDDSVPTLDFGPVTDPSGEHEIEVRIEEHECPDTMADIVHPMRATAVVDGEELSGCARPLDDSPAARP